MSSNPFLMMDNDGKHYVYLWQDVEEVGEYDSQVYFCTDTGEFFLHEERYTDDGTVEALTKIAFHRKYFHYHPESFQHDLTRGRNEVLKSPTDFPNAILPPENISDIPTMTGPAPDSIGIFYLK